MSNKHRFMIPNQVDLTPKGKIVQFSDIGEKGYVENVNYSLVLNVQNQGVEINYYGEDDSFLDVDQIEDIISRADDFFYKPKIIK